MKNKNQRRLDDWIRHEIKPRGNTPPSNEIFPVGNAEGQCPQCGADLGIDGRCLLCEDIQVHWEDMPHDEITEEIRGKLDGVFTCLICGRKKTHHRLYGYRCSNPEHAARENELRTRAIKKALKGKRS